MYWDGIKYKKVFNEIDVVSLGTAASYPEDVTALWLIVHCDNNVDMVNKVQCIVECNTNADFMIMIFKNVYCFIWKHENMFEFN